MNRPRIVAGNWKMNTTPTRGADLVRLVMASESTPDTRVIFGVPAIQLMQIKEITAEHPSFFVAAQNMHHKPSGAYTGEISAEMLQDVGIDYVILGHSERREYFNEDDDIIATKVQKALEAGILPIYCCGEKLEVREDGNQDVVVGKQIEQALFNLTDEQMSKLVIAYEPVWAIGTGKTASPEQAQDMHAAIRRLIENRFGSEVASIVPILYGGSVKPANAAELFAQPDVDGALVGGASLDGESFAEIIRASRES